MTVTSTRTERGRQVSRLRIQITERRVLLALLVVSAAVQSVIVLRLARSSWFGGDALYYLTLRGPVPSADEGLLRPHGGHWQTIPILVYRGLFAAFGLRSYLPYVAVALAVHIALVFVVFLLLRAVDARDRTAAAVAWIVLFFGGGAEAFMTDAPMVLTSSLLLGLVAALVLARTAFSGRGVAIAGVLLLAGVMCSGAGLVSAVTVACFVLLRKGLPAAALVSAPGLTAFVVWFLTVGHDDRVSLSWRGIPKVPAFVWSGMTGSSGAVLGIPGTGAVVFLALAAVVLWSRGGSPALRQLAVAGLVGALAQLTLASLASVVAGSQAARVGRYEYIVLVLLTPALAMTWEASERGLRLGLASQRSQRVVLIGATLVVLGVAAAHGIDRMHTQAQFDRALGQRYRTWVYGSVAAARAGESQLVEGASTGLEGGRFELLAQPQLLHELPPAPATPETRLDAESEYFTQVSAADPGLFSPTVMTVEGLTGMSRDRPGCHALTVEGSGPPIVTVRTGDGTEVGITSSSTVVTTQLVRDGVVSATRTWAVTPGPVYVASTARDAALRIAFNGSGDVAVCHQ